MVGTGIFTTTGFLAGDLGSVKLVLVSWVAGAICALAGALCYAELGSNFPESGGEYVYLKEAFGPALAFLSGWVSFFAGFSAPIAAAALAFSDYLGAWMPVLRQANAFVFAGSGSWAFRLGGAQLVAMAAIAALTLLSCLGIERAARAQNALTALKLIVLILFIALGFASARGDWSHLSEPARRWTDTPIPAQFAVSLFWIYVSYSGWNAATYVAEELKNPARTLPLALGMGTTIVAILYVALNVVFIYAAPLESMKGVVAVGALTASRLFGSQTAIAFSAAIAVSLLATINAMVIAGPRVYFAMARNGMFFARAAKVDPRWHTPVTAIVAQGVCAILMTLTPFPQLIVYIGFTLNLFAALSVISLLRFRRRNAWKKSRGVSFAYPLVPVFSILVSAWMTVEGIRLQPAISLAAAATLIVGVLLYRLRARPKGIRGDKSQAMYR